MGQHSFFLKDRPALAREAATKQFVPGNLPQNKVKTGNKHLSGKSTSSVTPVAPQAQTIVTAKLFPGGLWLELTNAGPMQLFQAMICNTCSNRIVAQQNFALPIGTSSFFWSFDTGLWPEGTYALCVKSERYLLQ